MYIEYRDILTRVGDRFFSKKEGQPIWWLNGVPRFEAFKPDDMDVYIHEAALVHTECQMCGTRYDIGVTGRGLGRTIPNTLAYESQLDIGDPPNACPLVGGHGCGGCSMMSLQITVLQYWSKDAKRPIEWKRDSTWERRLVDWDMRRSKAAGDENETENGPAPVQWRIIDSERRDEFSRACHEGDFEGVANLLADFDCERPREVAHMLDLGRRHKIYNDELMALYKSRFGT